MNSDDGKVPCTIAFSERRSPVLSDGRVHGSHVWEYLMTQLCDYGTPRTWNRSRRGVDFYYHIGLSVEKDAIGELREVLAHMVTRLLMQDVEFSVDGSLEVLPFGDEPC